MPIKVLKQLERNKKTAIMKTMVETAGDKKKYKLTHNPLIYI